MKALSLGALLLVCACTTQSDDDAVSESSPRSSESTSAPSAPPTAAGTVPETTDLAVAPATTAPESETGLFCGDFGSEQLPALVAIDIASGDVVWRQCPDESQFIPSQIIGRAGAATLLLEQNGLGGESIRAVDDSGVERWQRPTRMGGNQLFVAGATAVLVGAEVEAIDAATGDVLWSHPVEEGTPIGASDSVVLVGSGGPYALSTDVEPGASVAEATMRALDPRTGEERWSQDVELVPGPPGQYSPSLVGTTVIVPHLDGTTDFFDAETGELLRNERIAEHLIPLGAVLLAAEPLGMGAPSTTPLAIIEPRTGNRSTPPPGIPVYTMGQQTLPNGSGVLMSSDPPVGPSAKLWLLDESTGAEQWSIPFQPVIGRSKDHVVVSDGPVVRVLSAVDGEVVSEFELPTDRGGVLAAAVGDEQVVLAVQSFSGPQGAPTQSEPPDCTGGTTLLDTKIEGEPLTIVEATEGDWFCATTPEGTTFGHVPAAPTAEPAFDQMSPLPGDGAWYTIIVPEGFSDDVRAVDERGQELIVARGRAADYLILIQPHIGHTDQFPAMAEKSVELLGADGALLARLAFSGFASEDVGPIEEVEYPDFVECVNEHGVEMELPTATGPLPETATPATPEQLTAAWSACRDIWIAVQRFQMQGGNPEFLEQRMFLDDCLAEAGFYTMMNQPMDVLAYPLAYDGCHNQSPGVLALAGCLEQAGLEREGDGQIRGGPYPPELSSAAWQVCRRIVVTWLYPPMMSPPQFIAAFDCAAEQGWIIPAMGDTPTPPELPNDVRTACVQLP